MVAWMRVTVDCIAAKSAAAARLLLPLVAYPEREVARDPDPPDRDRSSGEQEPPAPPALGLAPVECTPVHQRQCAYISCKLLRNVLKGQRGGRGRGKRERERERERGREEEGHGWKTLLSRPF